MWVHLYGIAQEDATAQVEVVTQRDIAANAEDVFDVIADYSEAHRKLLPEQFT